MTDNLQAGEQTDASEERSSAIPILLQFVLIPISIVCVVVLIVGGLLWLTSGRESVDELLTRISSDSVRGRWDASRKLAIVLSSDDGKIHLSDPVFSENLKAIYSRLESSIYDEDRRSLPFLARALGMTSDPSVDAFLGDRLDPDGDPVTQVALLDGLSTRGKPEQLEQVIPFATATEPALRRQATDTLGRMGGEKAEEALLGMLNDDVLDITWNAALNLARLKNPAGLDQLTSMMDREFLTNVTFTTEDGDEGRISSSNIRGIMINAMSALSAHLKRTELKGAIEEIALNDPDPDVRAAARDAVRALDVKEPGEKQEEE